MKNEFVKYIFRNIARKKKQSFFTVLCITVSSFFILLTIALNNGILTNLKEGINQAVSGQLTVYSTVEPGINILESRLKEQEPFVWDESKSALLRAVVGEVRIDRRIRLGSLVSFNEETSYLHIHAIEMPHLLRIQRLFCLNEIPAEGKAVVISESVANDLKCGVGDTVLLLADNINDYMSDEVAVVVEIFKEKGLAAMLGYTGFIRYDFGADIVQLSEDECVELIINSASGDEMTKKEIAEVRKALNAIDDGLRLTTWDETVPLLFRIVNVWKGGGYFTQTLFVIFSLIILINLISLIVDSRKKEFGTLLAMGFSWRKITLLVSLEYLLVTVMSVCLSYGVILLLLSFQPENGIYIASKDMQTALMTERLKLLPYTKDFICTLSLFSTTTLLAVLVNIARVKRFRLVALINRN